MKSAGVWLIGLARKIRSYFRNKSYRRQFGSGIYPTDNVADLYDVFTVDPATLERDLNTVERAVYDGSRAHPPADAISLDSFHRDLLSRIEQIRARQTYRRLEYLQHVLADLKSTNIAHPDHVLKPIFLQTVKGGIQNIFADYEPMLLMQRVSVGIATRAYSHFRTMNNRMNDAEVKPFAFIILRILLLISLCTLEFYVNVKVIGQIVIEGDYGSYALSAAISLTNLLFPLLLGASAGRGVHLITFKNNKHCRSWKAWFWGAFLGIGITFTITANAFFASMRENIIRTQSISSPSNVSVFLEHPLGWVGDPLSASMFMMGLVMALAAFHEGVGGFYDPYPRYSRITKSRDRAVARFQDTREQLYLETRDLFEDAQDDISDSVEENRERYLYFDAKKREFEKLSAIHNGEALRLNAVANMVARSYRDINVAHRGGAAAPAYFNEMLIVQDPYGFDVQSIESFAEHISRRMLELEDAAARYRQNLTITEELEEQRIKQLLQRIEGHADARAGLHSPVLNETQAQTYRW